MSELEKVTGQRDYALNQLKQIIENWSGIDYEGHSFALGYVLSQIEMIVQTIELDMKP